MQRSWRRCERKETRRGCILLPKHRERRHSCRPQKTRRTKVRQKFHLSDPAFNLPNAPITEAVFGLEAPSVLPEKRPEFLEKLKSEVGDGYPIIKEGSAFQWTLTEEPDSNELRHDTETSWLGYQFQSSDGLQIARFEQTQMTFHRLAPYTSFDDLIPEVKRLWAAFQKLVQTRAITKAELRFVNKFELPVETDFSFRDYFRNVAPENPALGGLVGSNSVTQTNWVDPDTELRGRTTIATEPRQSEENGLPVVFDIGVFSTFSRSSNSEKIWTTDFPALRELKKPVFLRNIDREMP